MLDDLVVALHHKVPKVQVETCTWLQHALQNMEPFAVVKLGFSVLPMLVSMLDASSLVVREAAILGIAAFAQAAGSMAALGKGLDGVDEARRKRLTELLIAWPQTAPMLRRHSELSQLEPIPKTSSRQTAGETNLEQRTGATCVGRLKGSARLDEDLTDVSFRSSEEISAVVGQLVGTDVVAQLSSPDWKVRLEAICMYYDAVAALPTEACSSACDALLRQIGISPSWEDRNFQVASKCFEVAGLVAHNAPCFSRRDAAQVIGPLTAALADAKLKACAAETLSSFSGYLGLRFTTAQILKRAAAHKSPKVLEAVLLWVAAGVDSSFDVRLLADAATHALANSNPNVKAAAVRMLGAAHVSMGPSLRAALADVKPPVQQLIAAEFSRCPFVPPPDALSTRSLIETDSTSMAAARVEPLPRDDLSTLITPKLISDLGAGNWKVRHAALETLATMVAASGRISPTFGDLMPALRARLTDANKMLVIAALGVVGSLAEAAGASPVLERAFRPVFPELLKLWGDPKKQVRDAVSKALSSYVAAVSFERVLPVVGACVSELKMPADGRREALAWLLAAARMSPPGLDMSAAFAASSLGMMDKAAEVRELAGELLTFLTSRVVVRIDGTALTGVLPSASPPTSGAQHAGSHASTNEPTALSLSFVPASALAAVTSFPPIVRAVAERKEERLARLPRKPLVVASSKDPNTERASREAAAAELASLAAPYLREDLFSRMFSDNFKKHVEAVEILEVRDVLICLSRRNLSLPHVSVHRVR